MLNVDPLVLSDMIAQIKVNPAIRADPKKLGYSDEQIPSWVAAGAELPAEGAADSWLQKAKQAGAPVRVCRDRKKTSAQLSCAQLCQLS